MEIHEPIAAELIVDGHAHTYHDKIAAKIVGAFTEQHHMEPTASIGKGTVEDILERMAQSDINYTVMANFAPIKSVMRTNEWSLEVSRAHPNLIPLVSVYPCMSIETVKDLFARGARGVKMHNGIQGFDPCDDGLSAIYRYCDDRHIPVTFHCGETSRVHLNGYTDIERFLSVLGEYRNIPFVMTHLAAGNPETVRRLVEDYGNILFDTSIALTGEHCIHRIHDDFWEDDAKAAALIQEIGSERFAFGSDYPFGNQESDIRRIRNLPLPARDIKRILGENTMALYTNE